MERVSTAHRLYASDEPIKIGVSSCLLGAKVRFDGGHKRSEFLVDTLGSFVEFVPVCPEVEIGLNVSRETLRLVRAGSADRDTRLVTNKIRHRLHRENELIRGTPCYRAWPRGAFRLRAEKRLAELRD
jgi:hypothetical protein